MEKLILLSKIKKLYDSGTNIIQYLKKSDNITSEKNSKEDILISYDFQAGSYSKSYDKNFKMNFTKRLADIINGLNCNKESILDAGVGEATTLVPLLNHKGIKFKNVYGFDISWSRIKYAEKFIKAELNNYQNNNSIFTMGGGRK